MRIRSKFVKNMISKLAHKMIFKKTGYDVDVQFNEIDVEYNEKAHVHLSVDVELDKEELSKLLKSIGLD